MPANTVKNKFIIKKYKEMINYEPDGSAVVGSFVHHDTNMLLFVQVTSQRKASVSGKSSGRRVKIMTYVISSRELEK